MILKQDFRINLSMLSKNNHISNKSFLTILQDIAEMHSASIGAGVTNIYETHFSWALLNWKVKILKRPKYGDVITVNTWSRYNTKLYSYRDFEVYDSDGNVIAIATSKWILIDAYNHKIARITDDLISKYKPEDRSVFGIVELEKMREPLHFESSTPYIIRKSDIDINNHVNNLCYMDMALEAFPGGKNDFDSFNEFEILYKHQIKFNDEIVLKYSVEDGKNIITIKDTQDRLHSIITLF